MKISWKGYWSIVVIKRVIIPSFKVEKWGEIKAAI